MQLFFSFLKGTIITVPKGWAAVIDTNVLSTLVGVIFFFSHTFLFRLCFYLYCNFSFLIFLFWFCFVRLCPLSFHFSSQAFLFCFIYDINFMPAFSSVTFFVFLLYFPFFSLSFLLSFFLFFILFFCVSSSFFIFFFLFFFFSLFFVYLTLLASPFKRHSNRNGEISARSISSMLSYPWRSFSCFTSFQR